MTDQLSIRQRLELLEIPENIQRHLQALTQSEYFQYLDTNGFEALLVILTYTLANNWPSEEIERLLFNPIKPNKQQIDLYRQRHHEIYSEQSVGLSQIIDNSSDQFFAITSSMYAGKSTLASEVCKRLEDKGYRVITMVPFFMGDFITIRGRECTSDDEVGEDGFARISAVQYNPETYEELFRELNISKEDKVILHFDEFSFLPPEAILQFIEYIKLEYPNIKVIFVGLNKDLLGKDLDGYLAIKGSVKEEFSCQSFVPAPESNEEPTELMPTGTYSTRYLILPDGTTVMDCGFLPIVVEKEWAELVYYTPSTEERHVNTMLQITGQGHLLQALLNPSFSQIQLREQLFDSLKRNIIANKEEA